MIAAVMPNETAGLSEPPEVIPIARPPAVTHEPMMKPVNSGAGLFLTVATQGQRMSKRK